MICYCINNKRYIGITNRNLNARLKRHISDLKKGLNFVFYRAIRKYGINNFKLEWSIDYTNQCSKLELQEIEKYNTLIVNCCKKRQKSAGGFRWSYDNIFPEYQQESL